MKEDQQQAILPGMEQVLANPFKLSVSKTKTYLDCPKKYHYTYILKLPRKEREYHALGRCIHQVLEDFHIAFINGSLDTPHFVMGQAYKKAMEEYKGKINKTSKDEIFAMLQGYLKRLANVAARQAELKSIKTVEQHFNVELADNIILNGMIDRVQVDADGVVRVCDYKTTKNKKYLKDDFLQLMTYAFALHAADPTIERVRGTYILLRHNFEEITKEFGLEEIRAMKKRYEDYAKLIQSDTMYEAKPSKLCSYCDAFDVCKDGQEFINGKDAPKAFGRVKLGEGEWK